MREECSQHAFSTLVLDSFKESYFVSFNLIEQNAYIEMHCVKEIIIIMIIMNDDSQLKRCTKNFFA